MTIPDALVEKAAMRLYASWSDSSAKLVAHHFQWYHEGAANPNSCVHNSNVAKALAEARTVLERAAPDLLAIGRAQGIEEAAKIVEDYPLEVLQFYSRGPTSPPGNMWRAAIREDFIAAIRGCRSSSTLSPFSVSLTPTSRLSAWLHADRLHA